MIVFLYLLKMVIFIFQFYFVLHFFIQYQIIFSQHYMILVLYHDRMQMKHFI
jgi:hypothetical protein